MNKLILLLLLVGFGALALMFDWFDSREWFQNHIDQAQTVVEQVQQTGDELTESLQVLKNLKEGKE